MTATNTLGLTTLGTIHTAISLVALAAGIIALVRDKAIVSSNLVGKTYVITTIITCLTGFGIFQHGGFGVAHALGVVTLVVLGIAAAAEKSSAFGRLSPYIATLSYSLTFFFHLIPGVTETGTRLPVGTPFFVNDADPALQKVIGLLFLAVLIGCTLQVLRLRAGRAKDRTVRGLTANS